MHKFEGENIVLQYADTREIMVEGGGFYRQTAGELHRFLVCANSDMYVSVRTDEGEERPVAAGEIVYVPAGLPVAVRTAPSSADAVVVAVMFRIMAADGSGALTEPNEPRCFRMPQMKNWIAEFVMFEENEALYDYFRIQSRLYALAAACLASDLPETPETPRPQAAVERARQRMLESCDSQFDMDQLARSVGLGPSQFYRLFRKYTGLSPHKFLMTTRLDASLRLLADPGTSVSEAAHSVGYSDEYYFSRMFKREMGLTPTEFASRAQTPVAILSPIFAGDFSVLGITPCVIMKRGWESDNANLDAYLEEIALAKPKVMVVGPIEEELVRRLKEIAPVKSVNWYRMSWKQRLEEFGELLGLQSVARRWLAEFERKTDNARMYVRQIFAGTPFLIIGAREGNFRVYGTKIRKFKDLMYKELTFEAPQAVEDIGFFDAKALAEAARLDCDNVLILIEFPASEAFVRELEEEWMRLKQGAGHPRCFFIRLDEPFVYNAAMHKLLVDQTVLHLLAVSEG